MDQQTLTGLLQQLYEKDNQQWRHNSIKEQNEYISNVRGSDNEEQQQFNLENSQNIVEGLNQVGQIQQEALDQREKISLLIIQIRLKRQQAVEELQADDTFRQLEQKCYHQEGIVENFIKEINQIQKNLYFVIELGLITMYYLHILDDVKLISKTFKTIIVLKNQGHPAMQISFICCKQFRSNVNYRSVVEMVQTQTNSLTVRLLSTKHLEFYIKQLGYNILSSLSILHLSIRQYKSNHQISISQMSK
ncbi:unnamed protein product (macronuclear) [Paramecium tetraurelia]|uniref:Uncharacterized protein n=1 Tax=Paramecium tetraurelia TaxID=5888 RepID=A0DXH5_PARTE|nr:uncharacterized protein GSPATT00021375001 [Paramecium tetraurelia]CAK87742.1 unnamed protein product [Paramecium tetraurelia]|eukprot:XP_001455139.1 hypothetical protein (macronuclear) [Paramecium tetraurelia strain d4-2]